MPKETDLTIYTSLTHLYLTIPIRDLKQTEALTILGAAAIKAGATPNLDLDLAGILGESDGPTLYCMRAARNAEKSVRKAA